MSSNTTRLVIEVVLGLVIVVLAYVLYRSITDPARALERREAVTEATRGRMMDIRTAMIYYEQRNDRYPTELDSLVYFLEDSLTEAQRDSLYQGTVPMLDSLLYSPRSGNAFMLTVNDTVRTPTYLLEDPDRQADYIGTADGDITELNAASWE